MKNFVELKSVGSFVDVVNLMLYPSLNDGTPDLDSPTPLKFWGVYEDQYEWWSSLSKEDLKLLLRSTYPLKNLM